MNERQIKVAISDANSFARAGDFQAAEKALRRALSAAPDRREALDLMGFVLFFLQRYREAEECCRKSLQVDPANAYATKGLGLCLARQGRVDEGLEALRQAIAMAPQWLDPRWDAMVVCGESDRKAEGTRLLKDAWKALPQERSALREMASKFGFTLPR